MSELKKISNVRENGVVLYKQRRFIVVERWPRGTIIQAENGERVEILWQYDDPEVLYLGQGQIVRRILLDKEGI